MPKPKKTIDSSSLNQIDVYTHDEHNRANIPPVGMAQYDMAASPEAKYEHDPHIDPSLQWAGKKEGTSFYCPHVLYPYSRSHKPPQNNPLRSDHRR
jgi:adenine-specific DNA-methyltransferase